MKRERGLGRAEITAGAPVPWRSVIVAKETAAAGSDASGRKLEDDGAAGAAKPLVAVVGTGGTISTRSDSGTLDLVDYMVRGTTLPVHDVLQAVPEVEGFAKLLPAHYQAFSSTNMSFAHWDGLASLVERLGNDNPNLAGIVILHGTATMEETAYILHLTLKASIPVVITGAQRPLGSLSSDAPLNLLNAVRVATSPAANGMGVLVCLNDEIHAAREVTKSSTTRLHTFRTPDFGILGQVDCDGVRFYRRPTRRGAPDTEFARSALSSSPRVDIAYSYAGCDGSVIDALVAAGAAGIVVACFASGRLSPGQEAACRRALKAGVPVVLSTRAVSGRAMVAGSLQEMGMVPADNLNPQKARLLLSLALTITHDPAEIDRIFKTY